MTVGVVVEKEMGMDQREFFRVMKRALADRDHRIEGNRVRIGNGPKRLEIDVSDEPQRRVGGVVLPVIRVRFAFSGYGDGERAETMAWFDRRFQRAGG